MICNYDAMALDNSELMEKRYAMFSNHAHALKTQNHKSNLGLATLRCNISNTKPDFVNHDSSVSIWSNGNWCSWMEYAS